jgi:hypothetical protein
LPILSLSLCRLGFLLWRVADLVSLYALELLDALLHMLRLAYDDPPALGTAELAAAAIDHLERIIDKKVPCTGRSHVIRRVQSACLLRA